MVVLAEVPEYPAGRMIPHIPQVGALVSPMPEMAACWQANPWMAMRAVASVISCHLRQWPGKLKVWVQRPILTTVTRSVMASVL
jgi:hypothetical protein